MRVKTLSWRKDPRLNDDSISDTCHREIYHRNIRDKRLSREACFDLGDARAEKDSVTFNEEEDEHTLVEEGP